MGMEEKLSRVLNRHDELSNIMATAPPTDAKEFAKMSKEFSDLGPIVEAILEYRQMIADMEDAKVMAEDPDGDAEMKAFAEEELYSLKKQLPALENNVKIMLLPKDEADERNAIMEIRAGTGGDEAALFGGDLLRMYERYASLQGWRFEVLDASAADVGGVKEASIRISGQGVFARLKFESGVHRVQRVPETESGGRVHTSAATVAVLPEAEEVDVQIETKDLRIDTYRSQGAGGQHVNTTDSAVRITHIPTGVVAQCQEEKSQHKNRDKAMAMLRAKLFDLKRQQQQSELDENRRSQVGSGDRSERIRTYNWPQGRVTDHRINLTLYKLDQIVAGDALGDVIDPLIAEDQAARLSAVD
jgi:peptide chain release factor 1